MSQALAEPSLAQEGSASDRTDGYKRDVYSWARAQARLIREGRFEEVDAANVAEEIESVGRSERSSLRSYLARVLQHLLKWDH